MIAIDVDLISAALSGAIGRPMFVESERSAKGRLTRLVPHCAACGRPLCDPDEDAIVYDSRVEESSVDAVYAAVVSLAGAVDFEKCRCRGAK